MVKFNDQRYNRIKGDIFEEYVKNYFFENGYNLSRKKVFHVYWKRKRKIVKPDMIFSKNGQKIAVECKFNSKEILLCLSDIVLNSICEYFLCKDVKKLVIATNRGPNQNTVKRVEKLCESKKMNIEFKIFEKFRMDESILIRKIMNQEKLHPHHNHQQSSQFKVAEHCDVNFIKRIFPMEIRKSGSSLIIVIPYNVVKLDNWKEGDEVDVTIKKRGK